MRKQEEIGRIRGSPPLFGKEIKNCLLLKFSRQNLVKMEFLINHHQLYLNQNSKLVFGNQTKVCKAANKDDLKT
jgi:hypothetical protein